MSHAPVIMLIRHAEKTAPDRGGWARPAIVSSSALATELKVANRELGTVQSIMDDGRIGLKMDGGRSVSIDLREYPLSITATSQTL